MKVVDLKADQDDREEIIRILEEALEKAKKGEILDAGVVYVARDEDAEMAYFHHYYGHNHFALLLAGVSAMEFDMNMVAYENRVAID